MPHQATVLAAPTADEHGVVGKPVQLGDDTTITISNPRVGDDDGPWIEVDVAFTNNSSTSAQPPNLDVVCAGATSGEGYQSDSIFDPNADVKPGATSQGTLNLLPTGNNRIGPVVPECKGPAVIKVGNGGPTVPLPDDVLQAYNTAARSTQAAS